MAKEDCAKFLRENKDPRCQELHTLINDLYKDLNLFKTNFKTIVKDLKSLLEEELINQEMFDSGLHIINNQVIIYNKINQVEILIYHCCACNKYFLEKENNLFLEEIPTKQIINYASEGFCSSNCSKNYHPLPAETIVDNPK